MMEALNVRCCDAATFVALINMLKDDLSSTPEIYRTMLAVLCDFDPYKHGNRERTVRYIRLLVKDKVLANCLLTSLPQASVDLQNLPFYTGTLPDMKRVLRQKFKGMKVSLSSPEERAMEKRNVSDDTINENINQNITVIITDEDQAKTSDIKDANNYIVVQTPPDSCSHSQGRIENTTSVIAATNTKFAIKSSINGPNKETPACMKLSMPVVTNVPKPVVINQPALTINLNIPSHSKTQYTSTSNVSRNVSQSRLDDLVALVKSRSNSGYNVGQDYLTTSAEQRVTNTVSKPAFYRGSDTTPQPSFNVSREQQFSQNSTQNLNSISQARLSNPLVPLIYQPYTYPIPGNVSYQSCLTGYTANPLLPWTPLTYFQGYTPNHFPHGPSLQLARPSSTSSMDTTLDLSMQKKNNPQTPARHNDTYGNNSENDIRLSKKRSFSVSSVPNVDEIKEPKQKVRKLSTEGPLSLGTNNLRATKSQIFTTVSDSTASYLRLTCDGDTKQEKQNSLKALQELTLRINGNSGVQSTQAPNLQTSRKSLSTGSLTDSCKHFLPTQKLNISKSKGDLNVSSVLPSKAVFKQYGVQSSQNPSSLPAHSSPPGIRHTETVQTSNIKQYQHSSCIPSVENEKIQVTYPQKRDYSLSDQTFVQLYGEPKISHSAFHTGQDSSLKYTKTLDTESSMPISGTNKKGPICMRSFPYSQHIQLPDGNVSVVDFPALLSQSSTNIGKSSPYNNKTNTPDENNFDFKADVATDLSKTCFTATKLVDTLTNETNRDGPNRYSLYMTKTDMPSKTEETIKSKLASPLNRAQENVETIDTAKGKETCLIIETTSENGTEQVQFKLDKQRSANLLGELLKFKPVSHTDQGKLVPDSRESLSIGSASNNSGGKCYQQMSEVNSDRGNDVVCNPADNDQAVVGNIGNVGKERAGVYLGSETVSPLSSLNVSPYLYGMLPDTTTLIDDDNNNDINNDEFTDCDEDDDDVFLRPIF